MPRFANAEPDIAALAALVAEGLEQAPEDFATQPVHVRKIVILDTQSA